MHKSVAQKQRAVGNSQKKSNIAQKKTQKSPRVQPKRNIRLTRVSRGGSHHSHEHQEGVHTNQYGADKWYNPDEDSDFEPHYETPPEGVAAFPFAAKPYKFSIRFGQDPDKVHELDIYEGETYYDAVYRQKLFFPDVKCNPSSTFMQEEQFFHGAPGCGGCIGLFPFGYKSKLPQLSEGETVTLRNFWHYRVNHKKTNLAGGDVESVRFLCTLNFTPDMDGVEIYAQGTNHPHFDDNLDFVRSGASSNV